LGLPEESETRRNLGAQDTRGGHEEPRAASFVILRRRQQSGCRRATFSSEHRGQVSLQRERTLRDVCVDWAGETRKNGAEFGGAPGAGERVGGKMVSCRVQGVTFGLPGARGPWASGSTFLVLPLAPGGAFLASRGVAFGLQGRWWRRVELWRYPRPFFGSSPVKRQWSVERGRDGIGGGGRDCPLRGGDGRHRSPGTQGGPPSGLGREWETAGSLVWIKKRAT